MERVVRRITRLLERRGLGPQADPDEADPLLRDQPLLAELYGASVQGRIATGSRAGNRVGSMGFQVEPENEGSKRKPGCANVSGFSLHSNVCIPAKARRQLENLCRYVARPAVAMERLSILPDGRVSYRLRHKWRDGTTHVLLEPPELADSSTQNTTLRTMQGGDWGREAPGFSGYPASGRKLVSMAYWRGLFSLTTTVTSGPFMNGAGSNQIGSLQNS